MNDLSCRLCVIELHQASPSVRSSTPSPIGSFVRAARAATLWSVAEEVGGLTRTQPVALQGDALTRRSRGMQTKPAK